MPSAMIKPALSYLPCERLDHYSTEAGFNLTHNLGKKSHFDSKKFKIV